MTGSDPTPSSPAPPSPPGHEPGSSGSIGVVNLPDLSEFPPARPVVDPADSTGGPTGTSPIPLGPRPGRPPTSGLRVLMLGWCLWLLGSWAATGWVDGPKLGARWMVFASIFGLMLGWPAFRLSLTTRARRSAVGGAFGDWICLMIVLQAVLWPLRMIAGWGLEQALWIDLSIAGWAGLAGGLIAWGRMTGSGTGRTLAMAFCAALLLGEPLVMGLVGDAVVPWAMRVSPVQPLWALTEPRTQADPAAWAGQVVTVVVVALVGAGVLVVWERLRKGEGSTGPGG